MNEAVHGIQNFLTMAVLVLVLYYSFSKYGISYTGEVQVEHGNFMGLSNITSVIIDGSRDHFAPELVADFNTFQSIFKSDLFFIWNVTLFASCVFQP